MCGTHMALKLDCWVSFLVTRINRINTGGWWKQKVLYVNSIDSKIFPEFGLRNLVKKMCSQQMESVMLRLHTQFSRTDKIRVSINNIYSTIDEIKISLSLHSQTVQEKVYCLKRRIMKAEQYARRNSMRIFGVKESKNENTDLK